MIRCGHNEHRSYKKNSSLINRTLIANNYWPLPLNLYKKHKFLRHDVLDGDGDEKKGYCMSQIRGQLTLCRKFFNALRQVSHLTCCVVLQLRIPFIFGLSYLVNLPSMFFLLLFPERKNVRLWRYIEVC